MDDTLSLLNSLLAGRYHVERELGSGGMGTVFLADDLKHQRRVALKVLHRDLAVSLGTHRFLEETRVTATLQHPHILPLFDSGAVGGLLFYVMPYVAGESLRDRLRRERELPVSEVARILRDVVDGLSAAHAQGIVHRDIKPENVLLSGRHAMIADFGIAKAVSTTSVAPQRTTAGVALGTPDYMAPEQVSADPEVDARADFYAAGAMAYEMLTGAPPFAGRPAAQVFLAHLSEIPRSLRDVRPSVDPEFAAFVMRCLEKQPGDRWQTADEMLRQLERFVAGMAVTGAQVRRPRRLSSLPAGLRRSVSGVLGLFLLTAIGVSIVRRPAAPVDGSPARLVVTPPSSPSGEAEEQRIGQRVAHRLVAAIDSTAAIEVVPQVLVQEAAQTGRVGVASLARRTSATHALAITVEQADSQLRVTLEFVDVRARVPRRLHALEVVSGPVDSIDAVIERAAQRAADAAVLLFRGVSLAIPAERIPAKGLVMSHLERASELGCEQRFREATEALRAALALDSSYVPALATLEYTLVMTGQWAAADSVAARLDALGGSMLPGERTWWDYRRAINAGDWSGAAAAAERGFRRNPEQWGHGAGFVALSTRRVADAITRLAVARPAAGCLVAQASVFRLRTQAYHLAGRADDELAEAARFLKAFPGSAVAWEAHAVALAALGRGAAVDSALETIDALPPQLGFVPALTSILVAQEYMAHGFPALAEVILRRTWTSVSARDTSRRTLALVAFHTGHWAVADSLLAGPPGDAPDNASRLRYRAIALLQLGRRREARELSERIGRMASRTHGQIEYYRATIAAAGGDASEASARLERAFLAGYGFDVRYHRDPWWDPVRRDSAFAALVRAR